MKPLQTIPLLLALAALTLWFDGCATSNVNPSQARPHTGYVDFYADSSGELSWQVERFDDGAQGFKSVFSEFEPLPGRVLRLAFAPGHYRFRVTFLNCVVRGPGLVDVEVKDGLITPVPVVLVSDGTIQVQQKEQRVGGRARGSYGWRNKYSSDEATIFRVSAEAKAPIPYQVKERMPYAR